MSLTSLALTVLTVPAIAGPAVTFPTEKELRQQARTWVDALCADPQPACETARGALASYESLLPETEACQIGPCDAARIRSLTASLFEIDGKAAALPRSPAKRATRCCG